MSDSTDILLFRLHFQPFHDRSYTIIRVAITDFTICGTFDAWIIYYNLNSHISNCYLFFDFFKIPLFNECFDKLGTSV